jgi:hypothetical protein
MEGVENLNSLSQVAHVRSHDSLCMYAVNSRTHRRPILFDGVLSLLFKLLAASPPSYPICSLLPPASAFFNSTSISTSAFTRPTNAAS